METLGSQLVSFCNLHSQKGYPALYRLRLQASSGSSRNGSRSRDAFGSVTHGRC